MVREEATEEAIVEIVEVTAVVTGEEVKKVTEAA